MIQVTDQSLCTIENLARMRVDSKLNSDVTLDPSGESPSFMADRNGRRPLPKTSPASTI